MSSLRSRVLPFLASASVLLAACGGGGGDAANDTPADMAEDAAADMNAAMDASAETVNAMMTGDAERPQAVTTTATGSASFTVYADSIMYAVNGNNLMGVTAVHVHSGGPEESGPPMATLYTSESGTDFVSGTLGAGAITRQTTLNGDATFDNLRELIRTGGAYVNVHTKGNPGGEVRGQISASGMM